MRFSLPRKLRRLLGLPEERYSDVELAELRQAIPVGTAKFMGYEGGVAVFVCVDKRANLHRLELDRTWMRAVGIAATCHYMDEAVIQAGRRLSLARRN